MPTPTVQSQVDLILAEIKHVERRVRLLKQLTAQLLQNVQSEEDITNGKH